MQAGFALLEVGSVRSKHAKSILFKNIYDLAFGALVWYLLGFGIAGPGASGAIGNDFALTKIENAIPWFHSMCFATTTGTIVSGAVAERMTLKAYLVIALVLVGVVYPLIVNWAWDGDGWLAKFGYVDFAGSGVVHLTGGTAALASCFILGPRSLRFNEDEDGKVKVTDFRGHSPSYANLGVYVLFSAWIAFNASSTLDASAEGLEIAGQAAATTVISAAASVAAALVYQFGLVGTCDLPEAHNALLAGCVAITASCAYVESWAALLIGTIGFGVYKSCSTLLLWAQIDDPLDAIAVHAANGIWGALAVGVFAKPEYLDTHFARGDHEPDHDGFLLGGNGSLLGAQLVAVLVIFFFTATIITLVAYGLSLIPTEGGGTYLRVSQDSELLGLDFVYHEGSVYPELTQGAVLDMNLRKNAHRRVRKRSNAGESASVSASMKSPTSLSCASEHSGESVRVSSTSGRSPRGGRSGRGKSGRELS
eukprot:scaffold63_cov306-Pinguiococcus_pyrenoidosus.AAC.5